MKLSVWGENPKDLKMLKMETITSDTILIKVVDEFGRPYINGYLCTISPHGIMLYNDLDPDLGFKIKNGSINVMDYYGNSVNPDKEDIFNFDDYEKKIEAELS